MDEDDEFTAFLKAMIIESQPPPPAQLPPLAPIDYSSCIPAFVIAREDNNPAPLSAIEYSHSCLLQRVPRRWFESEATCRQVASIEAVQAELPPYDWECAMLEWYANLLPDNRYEINDYMGYGYRYINRQLRDKPRQVPLFNQLLETAPVLPRAIVVYRYTDQNYEKGVFRSNGYLSVSYRAYFVYTSGFDLTKPYNILRITVPAGMRAIYTTSPESEIILPHGIELEVLGKRNVDGRTVYEVVVLH